MTTAESLRELISRADSYTQPLLSMYLDVNPAHAGNHSKAIETRAKTTMNELGVPSEISERLLARLAQTHPSGRSLVVFADADNIDFFSLDVDLPVTDPATGHGEARWGKPYVAPLFYANSHYPRCGVMYFDREIWRFFLVKLGTIRELEHDIRPGASGEDADRLEASKNVHPAHIADRGSAALDNLNAHVDDVVHRFYRDAARHVEAMVAEHEIDVLITMTPNNVSHEFDALLPEPVLAKLECRLSAPSRPDAPPGEILERVRGALDEIAAKRHAALLDRIAEEGTRGVDQCLEEIQAGRLSTVAVPWTPQGQVYRAQSTGYVALTADAALAKSTDGGDAEPMQLCDALSELAANFGVELEFMAGACKDRLERELDGMGGVRRWPRRA